MIAGAILAVYAATGIVLLCRGLSRTMHHERPEVAALAWRARLLPLHKRCVFVAMMFLSVLLLAIVWPAIVLFPEHVRAGVER